MYDHKWRQYIRYQNKCLNVSQKLGTRNTLSLSHSLFFDMLNNFCFQIQLVGSICTKSWVNMKCCCATLLNGSIYFEEMAWERHFWGSYQCILCIANIKWTVGCFSRGLGIPGTQWMSKNVNGEMFSNFRIVPTLNEKIDFFAKTKFAELIIY